SRDFDRVNRERDVPHVFQCHVLRGARNPDCLIPEIQTGGREGYFRPLHQLGQAWRGAWRLGRRSAIAGRNRMLGNRKSGNAEGGCTARIERSACKNCGSIQKRRISGWHAQTLWKYGSSERYGLAKAGGVGQRTQTG